MITAPEQYRADQDAVTSLFSSLSPLNADSVVEDKPPISKYGLAAPTLTVTVHRKTGRQTSSYSATMFQQDRWSMRGWIEPESVCGVVFSQELTR